jgi:hypothetical protein
MNRRGEEKMKRILTSLLMAVGITGPFVAHLAAQTNTAVADIPFAFVISNHTMPAGEYRVSELRYGNPVFVFSDARGHSIIVPLTHSERGNPEKPSVTFACYGKECVLAKVTPPNSQTAYALSQEAIEKNLPHRLGMASMIAIKVSAR